MDARIALDLVFLWLCCLDLIPLEALAGLVLGMGSQLTLDGSRSWRESLSRQPASQHSRQVDSLHWVHLYMTPRPAREHMSHLAMATLVGSQPW